MWPPHSYLYGCWVLHSVSSHTLPVTLIERPLREGTSTKIRYRSTIFTDTETHLTALYFSLHALARASPTSRCLCRSCIIHSTKEESLLQSVLVGEGMVMMHFSAQLPPDTSRWKWGIWKVVKAALQAESSKFSVTCLPGSLRDPCHSQLWKKKERKKDYHLSPQLSSTSASSFSLKIHSTFSSLLLTSVSLHWDQVI